MSTFFTAIALLQDSGQLCVSVPSSLAWPSIRKCGDPVPHPYPYADAPPFPQEIGTQPPGMPLHACMGLNSCRGADRFGTEGRPDTGEVNACAGQGYCSRFASWISAK